MKNNKKLIEEIARFRPILLAFLNRRVDNINAEDIVQDAFTSYIQNRHRVEKPRQWLLRVVKNLLIDHYKSKKNKDNDTNNIENHTDDLCLTFINGFKDTRLVLKEAIENSGLSEIERSVFDFICIYNYSQVATSKCLQFTRQKVQYKYKEAIKKIKSYLKEKGINEIEELL